MSSKNEGRIQRKLLKKPTNLKPIFQQIRNHFAGNLAGITRDEIIAREMNKIILTKIYDEIHTKPSGFVAFSVGRNDNPEIVKDRINAIFTKEVLPEFMGLFSPGESILVDANSLIYVVKKIQNYCLLAAERDALGDAFEVFIGPTLRGSEGQFFTPKNIISMVVDVLNPRLGETVIDPACGSGGFLVATLNHFLKQIKHRKNEKQITSKDPKLAQIKSRSSSIYGIDKDEFLTKIAKAYLLLLGSPKPHVFCDNALVPSTLWKVSTSSEVKLGSFDYVMTNPPFGAKISILDEQILEQFKLGHKWKRDPLRRWVQTKKVIDKRSPQVLFIERVIELLKSGGKAAIVLPDGILSNPTDGYIRRYILDNRQILAVIDLPLETFQPSTSTKTSIIFLQKNSSLQSYPIFMSIVHYCGHDRRGRPTKKDELPLIGKTFRTPDTGKKYDRLGFRIDSRELMRGDLILSPKYYNPDIEEELGNLKTTNKYDFKTIGDLLGSGQLQIQRGDEIGSECYGTGGVPFIRTSDLSNYEIRITKETCVDQETYLKYRDKQDIQVDDVLFTNEGGKLVGDCAIVTSYDLPLLIQSHIRKIRVAPGSIIDPYLLLHLLSQPLVRLQIESKRFVQSTIPTLGNRLSEVILPIPKDPQERIRISNDLKEMINLRSEAKFKMFQSFRQDRK
ncbi:MAG: N-6 DNA methylase [Candidatus Ranarchaeia archaeon]